MKQKNDNSEILFIKKGSYNNVMSFSIVPVHVGKCLITRLLSSPLVSRKISPSRASVSELITIILQCKTHHKYYTH